MDGHICSIGVKARYQYKIGIVRVYYWKEKKAHFRLTCEGKGRENVTPKVNSHSFKLHRSYSNPFNLSNAGDFSEELNSKGLSLRLQKEKENLCLVFPSSIEREMRKFHVVGNAMYKKV